MSNDKKDIGYKINWTHYHMRMSSKIYFLEISLKERQFKATIIHSRQNAYKISQDQGRSPELVNQKWSNFSSGGKF